MDGGGERVVYASSFSKTVCPGIRVGYLVGPTSVIGGVRKEATETYISPNMVAQGIVAEFCRSGAIEGSIRTVKELCESGATPPATRSPGICPTPASSRRRVVTSFGSTCPRARMWPRCSSGRRSAEWCS